MHLPSHGSLRLVFAFLLFASSATAEPFRVLHGFSMEPIAAEPLLTDPVDIAYDEDGRAYVAEMNDYPYTDKAAHKPNQENPSDQPIGKIRLLVDSDDDGVFDQSTIFADGLSWPTGVACWRGGIYVCATPDLWYFKDTNGDGVADEKRKIYTGFRKLNVQALVNNPVWGLDNCLYFSASTNGGTLTKVGDPAFKPLALARSDLRFDPRTETLELESGYGRFGNTFDDFGNRFVCNIRNPALHVVLPKRYLDRNPHLPPAVATQDVCGFGEFIPVHRVSPPEPWRVERAQRWSLSEASKHPGTELVGAGAVTSSCGITVYRGDAYPEDWRGQIFVADVASNLFLRLKLEPSGMTFKATRPDADADFCASESVWFRPVNFENAPDGCLHVLDMRREAIEHPWSIPDDIHAKVDLLKGIDQGRIYRLKPPGDWKRRPAPKLGKADTAELVKLLEHKNAWHRETAQRLLIERQDRAAAGALRRLLAEEYADEAPRIHALHTLEGLGLLTPADITTALGASDAARLKTHAVQVAEPLLKGDKALREKINALHTERDPRLLAHALLALSEVDSPSATQFAIKTATRIEADPWLAQAALSASAAIAKPLAMNRSMGIRTSPTQLDYVYRLARIAGATYDTDDLHDYFLLLLDVLRSHSEFGGSRRVFEGNMAAPVPEVALCALAGLKDGQQTQKVDLFSLGENYPTLKSLAELALPALANATQNARTDPAVYRFGLTLLPSDAETTLPTLLNLLNPETAPDVQVAALHRLADLENKEAGAALVEFFSGLTPVIQQQALEALLSRPTWLPALFDALESGQISPHLLSRARREWLATHPDAAIAGRAKALYAAKEDRARLVAQYQTDIAGLTPDPEAGAEVFRQFCIACHQSGDEGRAGIGPNLGTVKAWDPAQILTNILDPNREVTPDFIEYLVEKKDGTVVSGALVSETDAAVLLRRLDGGRESVSRRDIVKVKNSGLSVMPEGLEAVISPRQMADLIGWLRR